MKKKISFSGVLVCFYYVIVLLFMVSCGGSVQKTKLDKYRIFRPAITKSFNYTQEYVADIQSIQNVELRARVRGFVDKIYVDEGKHVVKGQLLFLLDNKKYTEELLQAEADFKSKQAELHQIDVEIANTKLLTEKNIISKSELEVMMAKREATIARIDEAKSKIGLANLNIEFTKIRAPFDGLINRIPNKEGSLIESGTLLTTLSNNKEVFAYFNVAENDYLNYISNNKVQQEGNKKVVQLQMSNGEVFPYLGLIETIESEIDRSTGNLAFRARFPNPNGLLKHGATGKVLVKNFLFNIILIPQASVFEVQERSYVFVVDSFNIVHQQKIDIKMRLDEMYIISAGVTPNTQVLFDGIQLVKEGDKIIPFLTSIKDLIKI